MLIECMIGGEGPNSMTVGSFTYLFRANKHGVKVCEVNSREAQERMLSLEDFKEYNPPLDQVVTTRKGKRRDANRTSND